MRDLHNTTVLSLAHFRLLYLLLSAVVITAVIGRKATHPGLVLGLCALLAGGLLILQLRRKSASDMHRRIAAIEIVVIEIAAIIVIISDNDAAELWFAALYTVFSGLLLVDMMLARD